MGKLFEAILKHTAIVLNCPAETDLYMILNSLHSLVCWSSHHAAEEKNTQLARGSIEGSVRRVVMETHLYLVPAYWNKIK